MDFTSGVWGFNGYTWDEWSPEREKGNSLVSCSKDIWGSILSIKFEQVGILKECGPEKKFVVPGREALKLQSIVKSLHCCFLSSFDVAQ